METINFLAQLWGFSLAIISLSFLVQRENIKLVFGLMKNKSALILSGGVGVIVGISSILTYNVWSQNWTVIITILGWAILLKGIIRLFCADFVVRVLESYNNKTKWFPLFFMAQFLVGCFLIYMGFIY